MWGVWVGCARVFIYWYWGPELAQEADSRVMRHVFIVPVCILLP